MANQNMQQNMGGTNQYGKMGMDGSRGMNNQMGTQSQMRPGMQNQMRPGIQSLMGSDMPSQMGSGMQSQMESNMQNQMGTGSMRNEMDRFSDQRGKNGRFSYSLYIPIISFISLDICQEIFCLSLGATLLKKKDFFI